MSKGLARSISRGPLSLQNVIRADIAVNQAINVAAAGVGVGFGTGVLAGLPQGNILLLGAVLNCTIDEQGDDSVVDTFDGDLSVGTAPDADGTLAGAEVDIIPSTATPRAVAGVSTVRAASTVTQNGTIIDNTAGTGELNLNLLVDAADITDAEDADMLVIGTLHLVYVILGDD